MKVRLDGYTRRGRAIDLRDAGFEVERIAGLVRDPSADAVQTPEPGPVHPHVGCIHPDISLRPRRALVAAVRSRGVTSPHRGEICEVMADIASISVEAPELTPYRRHVAETGEDVDALREKVARASGRVEATRESGTAIAQAKAELEDAVATLAEAETEHLAARQELAMAERAARRAWDERERRLSLSDRLDNLERRAEAWLLEWGRPRLERALRSLPGSGSTPHLSEGPDHALAMGIARISALRAPVVLHRSPFPSALAARAALDAPVILV
ncbi:MAG: hypothetical protein ABEJ27_04395 [Halodesulfurarchaeum sp.]